MKHPAVIKAYLRMAHTVFWTGKRAANSMLKTLSAKLGDDIMSDEKAKRMQNYAMQCYMSAHWFCILRGKTANRKELMRSVYLGAFAATIDDLNDQQQLTFSEILAIIKNPIVDNKSFSLAKILYEELMDRNNNNYFIEVLSKALKAQDESIKMLQEKRLEDEVLEKISRDKGGLFMLLYRVVLDNDLKKNEEAAILTLGYVMQLADDMFDVYEDVQSKQQTLITNTQNFEEIHALYLSEIDKFIQQTIQLAYDSTAIKSMLLEISTVLGRGYVCANQLLKLPLNANTAFSFDNYTRQELICDMEKPRNMRASYNYSVALYHTIKSLPTF